MACDKNFDMGHNLEAIIFFILTLIFYTCFPCNKTFLVTLTLLFDLLLKTLTLAITFKSEERHPPLDFHIAHVIPYDKTFHINLPYLYLVTLTLKFDLLLKKKITLAVNE